MIVAYHQGTIYYAYKGVFNYNIDHDWTGRVLVDFKKIVDRCTHSGSPDVQPAPSAHGGDSALLGIAFDKQSSYNYTRAIVIQFKEVLMHHVIADFLFATLHLPDYVVFSKPSPFMSAKWIVVLI